MVTQLILESSEFSLICDSFEEGVDLTNQGLHSRQVSHEAFRDENTTIVLVILRSSNHSVTNVVDDVAKLLMPGIGLLSNDNHVRAGLESDFNSHVGCLVTHETNEVPVLNCRCTVGEHVSYQLRVHFGAGVEPNSRLQVGAVEVTINRGGNCDDVAVLSVLT